MSRKRLGKGLQALIPEIEETPLSDAIDIETADILVNPGQPRKIFDKKRLDELASSVAQHGILQPLIVRPRGEKYELVAGERRLRAARIAGLEKVPVVVKTLTDREMMEIALIENLQREDLNPLEEAEAYRRLMEEFNYNQEQLAKRVGRSRSAIANTMRLTSLHPDVKKEIEAGRLTEGHARALLSLPFEKQPEAARKTIESTLSVRETEKLSEKMTGKRNARKKKNHKDSYLEDLEEKLRTACGTAVSIHLSARGGGKIEIKFSSPEDLERVCEIIL